MQFTGLKDKNGKEIYECDIVKWNTSTEALVLDKYTNQVDQIQWDVEDAQFLLMPSFRGPYGAEMEVIGNIHETPELLEVPS